MEIPLTILKNLIGAAVILLEFVLYFS